MKDSLYNFVMRAAGNIAARARGLSGTVFCFHSVTRADGAAGRATSLSVTDDFLRLLVQRLRQLDVPIVSLDDALARRQSANRAPFAALTFDDGYRDNGEVLHPLMERLAAPYAIFVTTALIDGAMPLWWDSIERFIHDQDKVTLDGQVVPVPAGGKAAVLDSLGAAFKSRDATGQRRLFDDIARANPVINAYRPYDSCLSWDRLRDMNASPYLTVGAHTRTHPLLARLDAQALHGELAQSRAQIGDRLGCAVDYLAYPFGQPFEYGPDAPAIARQVGYRAAFTTSHGNWFGADPFTLPRALIANKARHHDIPIAYMSPVPRRIKSLIRRAA